MGPAAWAPAFANDTARQSHLKPAKLAIVIDDIGYHELRGMQTIRLPGRMTLAVLPFAPHTQALVPHALLAEKEIIIHQPMEPRPSPAVRTEVGTLTLSMSQHEFDNTVGRALAAVPQSMGMSNHTGSLLTAHPEPMARVMRQLNQHGMFFLDSRTTADTVAMDVAHKMGVKALRRDVFLDHERNQAFISQAFDKALKIARQRGQAVLVGHPYPVTLKFLEHRLKNLPADIELVAASSLARLPGTTAPQRRAVATGPAMLGLVERPGSLRISLGR
ncbi:MAG: divergent polysaccharide deacetylase family protein [Pseudomonadota bacterium]